MYSMVMLTLTDLYAAYSTAIVISLYCCALLLRPISTSICGWITLVVVMMYSYFCKRDALSDTSTRATRTTAQAYLMSGGLIFFTTLRAVFCYVYLRLACIWLRLSSSIFRSTLSRTHCRVAIGVCLEFLTAPLASEYAPLIRLFTASSLLRLTTLKGTIFLAGLRGWGENLPAQLTWSGIVRDAVRLCSTILCTVEFFRIVLVSGELSATNEAVTSSVNSHSSTHPCANIHNGDGQASGCVRFSGATLDRRLTPIIPHLRVERNNRA